MAVMIGIMTLVVSACSDSGGDTAQPQTQTTVQNAVSGDDALRITETETAEYTSFSEYSFELAGVGGNYIVTVSRGEQSEEILINIEDSTYSKSSFVITSPTGYVPDFPLTDDYSSSVVNIITNDIDDTDVPDIMQFIFYSDSDSPENGIYRVSRFYTVMSGELREINIVDYGEDGTAAVRDYLDRTMLYHTEADKFICKITVDDRNMLDENGALRDISERVRINTLTLDITVPALISGYEEVSEDNPLYFGYAHWAAANAIAQYFTVTTLNIDYTTPYIEVEAEEGSEELSSYYFKIDDSRFSCVEDLRSYLSLIFTDSVAEKLMSESPMKYCDIDGELYGIAGDAALTGNLGTLTFSDMDISESTMLFRTRQETYDSFGNYTGYTDGGNFMITKQDNGSWIVIQYRYPYGN